MASSRECAPLSGVQKLLELASVDGTPQCLLWRGVGNVLVWSLVQGGPDEMSSESLRGPSARPGRHLCSQAETHSPRGPWKETEASPWDGLEVTQKGQAGESEAQAGVHSETDCVPHPHMWVFCVHYAGGVGLACLPSAVPAWLLRTRSAVESCEPCVHPVSPFWCVIKGGKRFPLQPVVVFVWTW